MTTQCDIPITINGMDCLASVTCDLGAAPYRLHYDLTHLLYGHPITIEDVALSEDVACRLLEMYTKHTATVGSVNHGEANV